MRANSQESANTVKQKNGEQRSPKDIREDRKWIIFIFSFPALAVFAGMITLYIAITNPDEDVADSVNRFGLSQASDPVSEKIIEESE